VLIAIGLFSVVFGFGLSVRLVKPLNLKTVIKRYMKTEGNFRYFLDDKEYDSFDAFEKAIKNVQVEIEVNSENLIIYAKVLS
jgi:translation elongation factor P/translation initiation factor 5A